MKSPALRNVRANQGITFRPQPVQSFDDTGFNTNEELDISETDITMSADASSILAAGDIILIEEEFMLVTAVVTVTVSVERGHGSDAATHTNPQDVFIVNTANTVLWLPGQDDPQSATIRDRSGFGNDGVITGTTWVQNSKGLWGLSFDGTDDIVTIPQDSSINDLEDVTYSMWVRPDSPTNFDRFFDKSGFTASPENYFAWQTGGFLGTMRQFDGGILNYLTNNQALTNLKWAYIALTIVNKAAVISVNGIESTYATDTDGIGAITTDAANDLLLGAREFSGITADFKGGLSLWRARAPSVPLSILAGEYLNERGLFGV